MQVVLDKVASCCGKVFISENSVVILPPSIIVAGIYTRTDRSRGVWKSPENERISIVIKPMVQVTNTFLLRFK